MEKIICIGSACKDIFFPTEEGIITNTPEDLMSQKKIAFELGAKYKIETRYESLGGCAANVAAGLSRLGLNAANYSHIGDDDTADWIMTHLKKNNIDTSLVSVEVDYSSDLSAIVVDKNTGDRVIFSNQKANGKMKIVQEKIREAKWLFIGDLHGNWEEDLDEIMKVAKDRDMRIAYNPRQSNIHDNVAKVIEAISSCDVIFLNKDESIEILTGLKIKASDDEMKDELFLIKKLKEIGPQMVAMTDGLRGAWAFDGKIIAYINATGDHPVDTTGAGDAFASGFLASHIKGHPLEDCLKWGTANAGNSVNYFGAIQGLLNAEEIAKKIQALKIKLL